MITWSLVVIVTAKYLGLVLRAHNNGEGGIMALTALLKEGERDPRVSVQDWRRRRGRLIAVGLFGAALLFGDAVLTPAISVLSAMEGLRVAAPAFGTLVVPLTIAVLAGLFLIQRRGTARIGGLLGPITLVWFFVLAALGIKGILLRPEVLEALDPSHALAFLFRSGPEALLVLGAVFLVVTGAEALYADLGHFGAGPIRFAWFTVVFPALLLNYFGQAALVLYDPAMVQNPFYLLAPAWGRVPLLVLATLATVIASQAVITGVFSLTMQAVQLGYWPRTYVHHTSAHYFGQIYVPAANWAMMVTTMLLVLSFRSSAALAGAYGIAIVSTMIVTTILLFVLGPRVWGWNPWVTRLALTGFLLIELGFLGANVVKIQEGGWVPLLIASILFFLMTTWRSGRRRLGSRLQERLLPLDQFLDALEPSLVIRVPGNAVYMTGNSGTTPAALLKNLEHQKSLHERVVLLSIGTRRVPYVAVEKRLEIHEHRHGFHRIVAHYGFMETPDVPELLDELQRRGFRLPLEETTFFLGRERPVKAEGSFWAKTRVGLFSLMTRNSQRATAYFNIPPDRLVEVGSQIEM